MDTVKIFVFTVGISIAVFSCQEPRPGTIAADSAFRSSVKKDSARRFEEMYLSESCNCCNWRLATVEQVDAIPTDSFKITESIAIEFFTLATRKDWFDSIDDGHQTYHYTIDQYGHYTAVIRPMLKQRGIKVIDTLIDRTVLFFEDDKTEYIVDVERYFHTDGVLMFTPGKAPVFWTAGVLSLCCRDSDFVNCYFGLPEDH